MAKKFKKCAVLRLLSLVLLGLLCAIGSIAGINGEGYWAGSFFSAFLGQLIYLVSITDNNDDNDN